ncbi:MAG TPA: hypothetical protein VF720_07425, partial [Candidatus Eisenbacteria bacterium]
MGDMNRTPALPAIVLTLVVVVLGVALSRKPPVTERLVTLGVGEVVEIDRRLHHRWQLTALSTDRDGRRTLFLKSLGGGKGGDVSTTLRLEEGTPLAWDTFEISLRDVRLDPARGTAVQLQWVPGDSTKPRPLFSVSDEEPVTLPADLLATIEVEGPIPPPGGGVLTLVIRRPGAEPMTGRIERGSPFPVGKYGALTWIGTSERWLTTLAIRSRRPA